MAKVNDPTKLSLSPTKVDTFFGCKRLFYYRYVRPPFTPPENKYFAIGNLAHKALELFYTAKPTTDNCKSLMGKAFKDAVVQENAFAKVDKKIITKQDLYSVKLMMLKYVDYYKTDIDHTVLFLERLVKVDIGNVNVWLKSDRVDKLPDGTYRVVDYKSGKPAKVADELDSVQIPSYGLWLVQQVDNTAENIDGLYVYVNHLGTKKGTSKHKITKEFMEKATEKYISVDAELKSGCEFTQNFQYKYCRFCDFSKHCREDTSHGF